MYLQVREVAERSKQRGNMLAQLFAAVRKVADAKQQLQDAEGELQEALAAAESYLQVRQLCDGVDSMWVWDSKCVMHNLYSNSAQPTGNTT